jgi:glycosyltransferase involved in cell wall biosynthesis
MHDEPFFSVIIPTRNRPHLLAACVRSVLAQDYPRDRYEIVAVDDGGRGGPPRALAPLLDSGPVRYLQQERRGWGQARLLGVRNSRGELLAFIDDDCVAVAEWLSCYGSAYAAHPEASGVGGGLRPGPRMNVAGRRQYLGHLARFNRLNQPLGTQVERAGWAWFTFGGNRSFRRDTWLAAQAVGVPSWYYDDYLIDLNLREMGARVYYEPAAWVAHHYVLGVGQRICAAYRYGRSEARVGPSVVVAERGGAIAASPVSRWRKLCEETPGFAFCARAWYAATQPPVWLARHIGQLSGTCKAGETL